MMAGVAQPFPARVLQSCSQCLNGVSMHAVLCSFKWRTDAALCVAAAPVTTLAAGPGTSSYALQVRSLLYMGSV
jgi:hypothetical protein